MAKAPRAGRVKTRLVPPLTPEGAAALSAGFLRDITENIRARARDGADRMAISPMRRRAPRRCSTASGRRHPAGPGRWQPRVPPRVQGFGRCLLHASGDLRARARRGCVLNSDSPTLPTALLVEAARRAGRPAIASCWSGRGWRLLPARHEGAARRTCSRTSPGAPIASPRPTRDRARTLGLELVELETWYDVDDATGLAVLLEETRGYQAPRTRATIARLGLRDLLLPEAR